MQRYIFLKSVERARNSGLVLTVLNAPLPYYDMTAVDKILMDLRQKITHACSVNICVGFMHSGEIPNTAKYKYASQNTMLLNEHVTILNRNEDIERLRELLSPQKIFDKLEQDFVKSYRIQIIDIFQISVHIWHASFPVGCRTVRALREIARGLRKHSLITFGSEGASDNNCFWRCLVYHLHHGKRKNMKRLVNKYRMQAIRAGAATNIERQLDVATNTAAIEDLFRINLVFYDKRGGIYNFPYSARIYNSTLHILLVQRHCLVITDVFAFFGKHACQKCHKFYGSRQSLCQHSCRGRSTPIQSIKFRGGIEQPEFSMFDKLMATGVNVPENLRYRVKFAAFDIECMLRPPDPEAFLARNMASIVEEHVPCSVAVAYHNDDDDNENTSTPTWILSDGDTETFVGKFFDCLQQIHAEHMKRQLLLFEPYLMQLEQALAAVDNDNNNNDDESYPFHDNEEILKICSQKPTARMSVLKRLQFQLYSFVFKLPIIGYNSSSYDLNVLKEWLFPLMARKSAVSLLKRRNRYLCIETSQFKFHDAYLYVAAGTSLEAFMKSQLPNNVQCSKLKFPYRYLKSLDVLQQTELPPAEHWILESGIYAQVDATRQAEMLAAATTRREAAQAYWELHDMRTFKDYLRAYNVMDVVPFMNAFRAFMKLFREKRIDVFQHITLPSIAKHYGLQMSPPGMYFSRFGKADKLVYDKIRQNLYGGVSLVWNRLVECDESLIRPNAEHVAADSEPEVVKSILGMDMSGCYLYASSEEHMTGPFFYRDSARNYEIADKITELDSILCIEHAVFEEFGDTGLDALQHRWKGGERRFLSPHGTVYKVDGFVQLPTTQQKFIFEYNGCYFHNHGCARVRGRVNPKCNAEKERMRLEFLETQVDRVFVIWECKWHATDAEAFIATRPLFNTWNSRTGMSVDMLKDKIINDNIKGLFEIDAYVPPNQRERFRDINPFFYRTDVHWDMIGDTMREIMSEQGRRFTKREMLLNPPFCSKLLLPHQYVKYLVEMGIEIVKIHSVIEFPYASCPFKALCDEISAGRQAATTDETKEAMGLLLKLLGNALYGISITNAYEFTITILVNAAKAERLLFQAPIRNLVQLNDDLYEITRSKRTITIKQPIQFGMNVYCLSKLRVLRFAMDWFSILQRAKFALVLSDTDSIYTCFADEFWENCCRQGVSENDILAFKSKWFPLTSAQSKQAGLWHVEYSGRLVVALAPKLYIAVFRDGQRQKIASRGISTKHNVFTVDDFKRELFSSFRTDGQRVHAQSFRMLNDRMVTLNMMPSSFSACYIKRRVLPNLINTEELEWHYPAWVITS